MAVAQRLDDYQRRHPRAGFPLAVLYKHVDDQGGYLAALLAYYAFLSLFPLLLLFATILGLVLAGHPGEQASVLHSTLAQFPVIGQQLQAPKSLSGGAAGLTVGILGALYGGLGVAQALQNAMNTVWRVPRNSRPNPIKGRGRSVVLLAIIGVSVIATTVLSAFGGGAGSLGAATQVLAVVVSLAVNVAVFIAVFRIATARELTGRAVLPGAISAAVIWQLLQSFGKVYVSHVVKHASATNGVFALVLGLLGFLYVSCVAIMVCAQINVVRTEHLYPRALLTPFTDRVDLTAGDRRAYAGQATAQRSKGFEDVRVGFGSPPGEEAAQQREGNTASGGGLHGTDAL